MRHDNEKQRITLIIPNSRWKGKRPWVMVPQYALILTALIKEEFDFSIIDCNGLDLGEDECLLKLKERSPDVILTSGMSVEYHEQVHIVAELARKACPRSIVIAGGVYPTVLEEYCLKDKNIDYIFMGHAEGRINDFLQLVLARNFNELEKFQGIGIGATEKINPLTEYITGVKKLVDPDYSHIDVDPYLILDSTDFQFCSKIPQASVITSRGCPHNCVFCASRTVSGRGIVFRSPESVLSEIEFLIKKYGIRKLLIVDDSFATDRRRVTDILTGFIERQFDLKWNLLNISLWHLDEDLLKLMKQSGCFQISVSIESGNQRVLDEIIHKPLKLHTVKAAVNMCKELGIDIIGDFIIGLPGESWEDIRETFRFAEEMDFDLVHFHIATPQPKTDLYRICKEKSLLPADFSFTSPKYYGFAQAFIETEEFTLFELKVLRAFEWDRINFKTPDKIAKVSEIYHMSVEHLREHRKRTRARLGLHCDTVPVHIEE